MNRGCFPFAGLFPLQDGNWRKICSMRQQNLPAAASQLIALPEIVNACPASLYLIVYESELTCTNNASVAISSTSDSGANYRALVGSGILSGGTYSVGASAFVTKNGGGVGLTGISAPSSDWSNTAANAEAAAGGPPSAGYITGFKVGVSAATGTLTISKSRLAIWALQ